MRYENLEIALMILRHVLMDWAASPIAENRNYFVAISADACIQILAMEEI